MRGDAQAGKRRLPSVPLARNPEARLPNRHRAPNLTRGRGGAATPLPGGSRRLASRRCTVPAYLKCVRFPTRAMPCRMVFTEPLRWKPETRERIERGAAQPLRSGLRGPWAPTTGERSGRRGTLKLGFDERKAPPAQEDAVAPVAYGGSKDGKQREATFARFGFRLAPSR